MKQAFVFSFSLLLSFPINARSTVFEFELHDLAGSSGDTSRTTTFVYQGPTGAVNSLSVRVIGIVDNLGFVECYVSELPDTSVWPLEISSRIKKPGDIGYWLGIGPFLEQLDSFDETFAHYTYTGGFSTVSAGDSFHVELLFGPALIVGLCGPITPPSTGVMDKVTVLIDVLSSVPVEHTTWGRIKSLFDIAN